MEGDVSARPSQDSSASRPSSGGWGWAEALGATADGHSAGVEAQGAGRPDSSVPRGGEVPQVAAGDATPRAAGTSYVFDLLTQRLRESEERYRMFVEHAVDAIWCIETPEPIEL